MKPLSILDLGSEPYERGILHGRAMALEVRENVETYLKNFETNGFAREAALSEGDTWSDAIKDLSLAYYEEMKGIADGADVPLNEVALLNARYEISFTLYGNQATNVDHPNIQQEGCTSFGLMPELTHNGAVIIGQNWDWLAALHGRMVVLRIRRDDGPNILSLNEAGIVGGKQGLNSAGIGLVENGLASTFDGANPYSKPFHMRCREVLEAETYDYALLPILKTKRTCSANFMIAHALGEIIDIETSPDNASYIYPSEGIITHGNHFTDDRHGPSLMERISPNTLYRAERLRRLLLGSKGKLNPEGIRKILGDHFGHPNAICRHPDERQHANRRTITNCAVLIDLEAQTMSVTDGPPCENDFVSYGLKADEIKVA